MKNLKNLCKSGPSFRQPVWWSPFGVNSHRLFSTCIFTFVFLSTEANNSSTSSAVKFGLRLITLLVSINILSYIISNKKQAKQNKLIIYYLSGNNNKMLLLLISSYDPYASSSFTSVDKPQVNPQKV